MTAKQLTLGIDVFLSTRKDLKNKRIALASNIASVTENNIPTRLALIENGFNLIKLFSPEHGLNAKGADGKYIANDIDALTNKPIISLYGDKLMPSEADLADIDIVLVDLPDIGCRFYTYLWTMTYLLEACHKYQKEIIITDRPNPLNGIINNAEGPMLDENCASFIGRWNIPLKHACTIGELANYFVQTKFKSLNFSVVPMLNWDRNLQNQFPFYPTSPAMQNLETAIIYPGTGLLEGINVNEGRGTDIPFKVFGAPWIDRNEIFTSISQFAIPYLKIEPVTYTPNDGLYANEICNGLQFEVLDSENFKAVAFGIILIHCIIKTYPNQVAERLYDTVANPSGKAHLDKLLGLEKVFEKLKESHHLEIDLGFTWADIIKPYLLY
jgi:uncharacterized protein YbbC (DUF1343 family)